MVNDKALANEMQKLGNAWILRGEGIWVNDGNYPGRR